MTADNLVYGVDRPLAPSIRSVSRYAGGHNREIPDWEACLFAKFPAEDRRPTARVPPVEGI